MVSGIEKQLWCIQSLCQLLSLQGVLLEKLFADVTRVTCASVPGRIPTLLQICATACSDPTSVEITRLNCVLFDKPRNRPLWGGVRWGTRLDSMNMKTRHSLVLKCSDTGDWKLKNTAKLPCFHVYPVRKACVVRHLTLLCDPTSTQTDESRCHLQWVPSPGSSATQNATKPRA